ncbi:MAG: tRNA (adenosine(37)-N6)-threonylcarbamoyltransferase complex dimerization subunit type 1 TsaB [Thermoleophilaceae bacterium]
MVSHRLNVIGLDTSTAGVAACALRADGRFAERVPSPESLLGRPAHARELMPALAAVMEEAGLRWSDLDLVAVSRGPGSFTGLRIGMATACGIADAHGIPVAGVVSLRALAEEAAPAAPPGGVLALIDARRGELFAALYAGGEELWAPAGVAPEALARRLATLPDRPLAVGDGSLRFRADLEAAGVPVAPEASPVHVVRALSVCRLALLAPGEPATALYLREPDARPLDA